MARAKQSRVEQADLKVARKAAPAGRHPIGKIAGDLSDLGDQPPLRTIAALTILAGALGRSAPLTGAGIRMLAAHQLATSVKNAIKHTVDRTRPEVVLNGGTYESGQGRHAESGFSSFPSGHTAGAVAVARAVGRDYPRASIPALALATAIAVIQVPRGKHFVSDIVAGALIGLAADWAVEQAAAWASEHRPPDPDDELTLKPV